MELVVFIIKGGIFGFLPEDVLLVYGLGCDHRNNKTVQIRIDRERCTSCGYCLKLCKSGAFTMKDAVVVVRRASSCSACGKCIENCVYRALSLIWEERALIEDGLSGRQGV